MFRTWLITALALSVGVSTTTGERTKPMFAFTRLLYSATLPENSRGKVYAVPQIGKMGVFVPAPTFGDRQRGAPEPRNEPTSSEKLDNATLFRQNQNPVRFRIISGDKQNFFKAESELIGDFAYLRLRTRQSLDVDLNRELTPEFSLRVRAVYRRSHGRPLEAWTEVLLKITDQNDLSPVFLPESYRTTVDRRITPLFTSLTRLTASDADAGLNGEVYYQLLNDTASFAIHPSTGVLSLVDHLDEETPSTFTLLVAAYDRASRLFSESRNTGGSTATVRVELTSGELAQVRWSVKSDGDQFRNCGRAEETLCAVLTDLERRSYLRQLEIISDELNEHFHLRSTKDIGVYEIRATDKLPEQLYNLTLTPETLSVLINVTGTAEKLECEQSTQKVWTLTVPEWAPPGYLIGDFGQQNGVKYQLSMTEGDRSSSPFLIDADSGVLQLKNGSKEHSKWLDYSQRALYEMVLETRCSDQTKKEKLLVHVEDCNDHAPQFVDDCNKVIIGNEPEENRGLICTLKATDADVDDNAHVFYQLTNAPKQAFHLDSVSGELKLRNVSELFFGEQKTFTLIVRASDRGWPLKRVTEKKIIFQFDDSYTGVRTEKSEKDQQELVYENNHDPQVTAEFSFEVEENLPPGYIIGTIDAFDKDQGFAGVVLYTLTDLENGVNRTFDIDLYNGSLKLLHSLDYEYRREYRFKAIINDLGTPQRRVSAQIVVKVLDTNDNRPKFEKRIYRVRISEKRNVGELILQLRANDEDSGDSGKIRYTLATKVSAFALNSETGVLKLVSALDRERLDRYRLLVQAQDGGQPPLSNWAEIQVIVEDENDNAPMCQNKLMKVNVPEDYPAGALVTCVDGHDLDLGENGRISYRMVDSGQSIPFSIDSRSGCIRLKAENQPSMEENQQRLILDYERRAFYNLTIELTDFGRQPLSSVCYVVVGVADVNENRFAPVFFATDEDNEVDNNEDDDEGDGSLFAVEATVYENEKAPTLVKKLQAKDPDGLRGQKPIYSVVDGDGLGIFIIDEDGQIFAVRPLDRETKAYYWLTVVARDRAAMPLSSSIDVFVRVLDRNDNRPMPLKPIYFASVAENSPPNVVVVRVEATDADFSTADDQEFASPPLTFRILRGDPQSFFKIDQKTGYISADRRSLDRETISELELEVSISDNGEPEALTSTVIVVVRVEDENDHSPTFLSKIVTCDVPSRNKYWLSDQKEFFVCRIFAIDEDEGQNANITYTIMDGNDRHLVRLDKSTGAIYVSKTSPWNDSEPVALTVRAVDGGSQPKQSDVQVVLTATPVDAPKGGRVLKKNMTGETFSFHVASSDPVGHMIGLLEVPVPEDERRTWFYLQSGNDDHTFSLRPDTGELQLAQVPRDSSYMLKYFVTCDGRFGITGQVNISIQKPTVDERPVFNTERIQLNVPENQTVDSELLNLSEYLTLKYGREEIRYFLSEVYDHLPETMFQIDAKTGSMSLKRSLDREHSNRYMFRIGARLRRGKRGYTMVDVEVMDVNDHAPKFSSKNVQIRLAPFSAADTFVCQMAAFDGDEGINGQLTYSISSGNSKETFAIDSRIGTLRLVRALAKSDASEFILAVRVQDGGKPSLTDTAYVRILFANSGELNNGMIQFSKETYNFQISKQLPIGHPIGVVQADGAPAVEYSLMKNDGDYLRIHPLSGQITLHRSVGTVNQTHLDATVKVKSTSSIAEDGSDDMAEIVISLTDGNDHEPMFKKMFYEGHVDENRPIGTVVLSVEATDEDVGQAGVIFYRIIDDWALDYFVIDYHTGAVRTKRPLDFEQIKRFEFSVSAEDLGSPKMYAASPALVEVTVIDVNDLPPTFDQTSYQFKLLTPSASGMKIGRVTAQDQDTNSVLQYELKNDNSGGMVAIDAKTGWLVVTDRWDDKASNRAYRLTVTVSDGVHEIETPVVINMENFVESTFRFEARRYGAELTENAVDLDPDTALAVVSVVGVEPGEPVLYQILNPHEAFRLDPRTGVLMTTAAAGKLDREMGSLKTLVVEARLTRQTTIAHARSTIVINILDVNDNAPKFIKLPYSTTLSKDSKEGERLLRVEAVDSDEGANANLRYTLSPNTILDFLQINELTGEITIGKNLEKLRNEPLEKIYELEVTATDSGSPPLSTTSRITVRLISGSTPLMSSSVFNVSVSEGSSGVGTVLLKDSELGENSKDRSVGYSIWSGDTSSSFDLDFTTGRLILRKSLDREKTPVLNLVVRAADYSRPKESGTWSEATVIVHVLDVNDQIPVFDRSVYTTNVSEDASINGDLRLVTLSATDLDSSGDNSKLVYKLMDEIKDEHFHLNEITGVLSLRKRLNYETKRQHVLTAVVSDQGTPPLSSSAIIIINVLDVNDNAPTFVQPAFVVDLTSPEWTSNRFIGQALAMDPDECDRGKLQYSIFGGNDEHWFAIDSRTGVVRTTRSSSGMLQALASEYSLNLTVSDGLYSANCRFLIKIRAPPEQLSFERPLYSAKIKETSAPGTFVTTVGITDRKGKQIKYRLISSPLFKIDEMTGHILTAQSLENSNRREYQMTVVAEKPDLSLAALCQLRVSVTEENNHTPAFISNHFETATSSETKIGTVILKIAGEDADVGDQLEYSLFDTKPTNLNEYLVLNSTTGELMVRRNLEAMTGSILKAKLKVTDRGNPPQSSVSTLAVRVVSESSRLPRFSQLEFAYKIREDAEVGSEVGVLSLQTNGKGGEVIGDDDDAQKFAFTMTEANRRMDWPLSVDRRTGVLRLIERLDYETRPVLRFYVRLVSPSSSQTLAATLVSVSLEDSDDNAPKFLSPMTRVAVMENVPIGTIVAAYAADDADSNANPVSYWLENTEQNYDKGQFPFKIDSETGWLSVASLLDRETRDTYQLVVASGDRSSANLRVQANVTVTILDANDQKPVFEQETYRFQVKEFWSAAPGTVLGRVRAVDGDLSPNNHPEYFIVDGNQRQLFDIRSTGELYLAKRPGNDDWMPDGFTLSVLALDGVSEAMTSVQLNFLNERVDCLTKCLPSKLLSVAENLPRNSVIGQLDKLPAGWSYNLLNNAESMLTIKTNGEIEAQPFDYELRDSYSFDVEIKNLVGTCESFVCRFSLTINVQDVNDNAPELTSETMKDIIVTENYNGTLPMVLSRVTAVDVDTADAGTVRYKLQTDADDDRKTFSIDSNTGVIFLWRSLDREERELYKLNVTAMDQGENPLTASAFITVKVADVNDNPPTFIQRSYDVTAPENTPVGMLLTKVEAVSLDAGENAAVMYGLQPPNSSVFEINERTGEIKLREPLDYEKAKEHSVTVVALDGGQPPLSSTIQMRLVVGDINDNDPTFERRHFTASVPENAVVGTQLLRIRAYDLDSGENGLISYRLNSRLFRIENDGWIMLAGELDYESSTRHEFEVTAVDHGQPVRSAVTVVTIDVEDVNDNAPRIVNCNRTSSVKARVSVTTALLALQVTDADGPTNRDPMHFQIVSNEQNQKYGEVFKIDASGRLYSLQPRLTLSEYHVDVSVRDSGRPSLTTHCRLHIRVTDESRFPPRLTNTSFILMTYMGEITSSGVIGRVHATDDDPKDSVRFGISGAKLSIESGSVNQWKPTDKKNLFVIDSDDGRVSAAPELQSGDYILNVTASDGQFDTWSTVGVSVRSINSKMLESTVSIRLSQSEHSNDGPLDVRSFVQNYLKPFTRAVATVVNARSTHYVHILSVQPSVDEEDTGKNVRILRKARKRRHGTRSGRQSRVGVDVLLSVQKSHHQDYFKPEFLRKALEQRLDELEKMAKLKVMSVIIELCRPDKCQNGAVCRERLYLYEVENSVILTETFSFVSPTHRRLAECVCASGYGGDRCEIATDACASKPCPLGHTCVGGTPNSPSKATTIIGVGYRCLCTGAGCPNYQSVHFTSENSSMQYTLAENLETRMTLKLTFRTVAPSGILAWSAGQWDYQVLELLGGELRYRYDLGDGKTVLYMDGPAVDDGRWHDVILTRQGRRAEMKVDDGKVSNAEAPGNANVLNAHGTEMYFGSGAANRWKTAGSSGFVGCLKDVMLNDDRLPWHGPGVRMYDVDVGHCDDQEFKSMLVSGEHPRCACLNNGTCVEDPSTKRLTCLCPPAYTGDSCDVSSCASSPCKHGGTCMLSNAVPHGFFCQCVIGFSGRDCSGVAEMLCGEAPCANGGTCLQNETATWCSCSFGWTGKYCRKPLTPSGIIANITVTELIIICAVLLALAIIIVFMIILCRRCHLNKRKKLAQRRHLPSALKTGENEPMFSESNVSPSAVAQRELAAASMAVASINAPSNGVASSPVSPAGIAPPLPPRTRFQPHRGSKLSNLESAMSTGIPTIQVRPLSMSERQLTPVDGLTSGCLEMAANYGSAAEELEQLGRDSPTLEELVDWNAALNRMNADSLEKLKIMAGITDEKWQRENGVPRARPPEESGDKQTSSTQRRLREDERSSGTYNWDYSDWNSTIGQPNRANNESNYPTLSRLSLATEDDYTATLPRGVCRLEETDSEYAGGESANEEDDEEARGRLGGDEFTRRLLELTRSFDTSQQEAAAVNKSPSKPSGSATTTFKSAAKQNASGQGHSYLDRYLPRTNEPPNSTASERRLLVRKGDSEAVSEEEETFAGNSSLLDTSQISAIARSDSRDMSDGERSADSVVPASKFDQSSASLTSKNDAKRQGSTLIVCDIDDDEDDELNPDGSPGKLRNNNSSPLKSKKQTCV